MIDREFTFAHPPTIALLQERFVPVALDCWYHSRREDDVGAFYREVVFQREGMRKGRTTQGFYAFDADGRLFAGWNNRDAEKVERRLRRALAAFDVDAVKTKAETDDAARDDRFERVPPEDGAVVHVYSEIQRAEYAEEPNRWKKIFRKSTGRDHLWLTAEDTAALANGELPRVVALRLARFHLIDNTRGEPPMWRLDEVKRCELELEDGVLSGDVEVGTEDGDRSFRASVYGRVETRDGALARFDLVARGVYEGAGRYTSNDAPVGPFELAIAFTLADPENASYRVPPQGSRWLPGYLRADR